YKYAGNHVLSNCCRSSSYEPITLFEVDLRISQISGFVFAHVVYLLLVQTYRLFDLPTFEVFAVYRYRHKLHDCKERGNLGKIIKMLCILLDCFVKTYSFSSQ
ncbi:MAG: hypothetical protein LN566_02705, partial [Rickettsia endosymbiont of Stiretrus anchorago]|nr:hypothetical protein [Rickettsia endosymbiont of Stiretrus anchorago]